MEKENEIDLDKIMLIYTNIFSKYVDYISKTSYYEVSMEYQHAHICNIDNVIEDNIPIEVICLKLVHNMTMIFQYVKHMITTTGGSIKNGGMKPNLYVKIAIDADYINVIKRKGFGLIGYNVDDMVKILFDTNEAIEEYLNRLISEDKKYQKLKIVINNIFDYSYNDVNSAIIELISKNLDIYKKYLNNK